MTDDVQRLESLKTLGLVSYVLHLIVAVGAVIPGGQLGTTLLIVALVLDLVKKDDATGTWYASHYRWRIRTVVAVGIAYLVTVPLWLFFVFPGWVAWLLISIWFLYRIVKGMVRFNAGQPMEIPE